MFGENMFQGKNGYVWWFGLVESNDDDENLGRCRVRIYGWHNENKDVLPDEALPWAYPITPITNSAVGGVGESPVGPMPGTRVFGFFADGEAGEVPIMTGTVPGYTLGFSQDGPVTPDSTPRMPITDRVFGTSTQTQEGDNPQADTPDAVTVNSLPETSGSIDINPSEWCLPFTGFVNSAYGARSGRTHTGVDICPAVFFEQTDPGASHLSGSIKGPTGLPVYAAAEGEVVYIWKSNRGIGGVTSNYDKNGPSRSSKRERSYGNAIAIKHTLSTGVYTTIYAHLGVSQDPAKDSPGAGISVTLGQKVSKGQQIGTVGRSHCWDSPTHLHFETRVGAGLPKTKNHKNPGLFFPQLAHVHTHLLSTVKSGIKYNKVDLKSPLFAPVKAKEKPKQI